MHDHNDTNEALDALLTEDGDRWATESSDTLVLDKNNTKENASLQIQKSAP